MMGCNYLRFLKTMYDHHGQRNLYMYKFDCSPSCPESDLGVCQHTSELSYVFGVENSDYMCFEEPTCSWTQATRQFSNDVISCWVEFATSGKPCSQWERWTPEKNNYMFISETSDWDGSVSFPRMDMCELWEEFEIEEATVLFTSSSNSFGPVSYGIGSIIAMVVFIFG